MCFMRIPVQNSKKPTNTSLSRHFLIFKKLRKRDYEDDVIFRDLNIWNSFPQTSRFATLTFGIHSHKLQDKLLT